MLRRSLYNIRERWWMCLSRKKRGNNRTFDSESHARASPRIWVKSIQDTLTMFHSRNPSAGTPAEGIAVAVVEETWGPVFAAPHRSAPTPRLATFETGARPRTGFRHLIPIGDPLAASSREIRTHKRDVIFLIERSNLDFHTLGLFFSSSTDDPLQENGDQREQTQMAFGC
jgi:hypothetical protein